MPTTLAPKDKTVTGRIKWRPKIWRPEYDRVVGYSVLGKSNTWIAAALEFTPQHVSNILCCPQGVELAEKLRKKLQTGMELNIQDELGSIARQAVKRLKAVMEDDELFEKSPFQVVDRGMEVLKGLAHLRGGGNGAPVAPGLLQQNNIMVITPDQKSDITAGLQLVKEVRERHG